MTNKTTERDIYNAMIAGTIDAETMKTFAEKKLAQLDKRNESAKIRAAKKRAQGDEFQGVVFSYVGNEPKTRAMITEELVADGYDTTVAKVGARLNKLVANGDVVKSKGKTEDNKAATFYALAE